MEMAGLVCGTEAHAFCCDSLTSRAACQVAAAALTFPAVVATRVCVGLGEGVALPSMNNLVATLPKQLRSTALGVAFTGFHSGVRDSPVWGLVYRHAWGSNLYPSRSEGCSLFELPQWESHRGPMFAHACIITVVHSLHLSNCLIPRLCPHASHIGQHNCCPGQATCWGWRCRPCCWRAWAGAPSLSSTASWERRCSRSGWLPCPARQRQVICRPGPCHSTSSKARIGCCS